VNANERPLAIPFSCPNCGSEEDLSWHSRSSWCNRCGWAQNRYRDPATGRHTTSPGREWKQLRKDGT
jgi:ribosomal protein L37E